VRVLTARVQTLLFADMTIILTPADARGLSRERMRRNSRVTTHAPVDRQPISQWPLGLLANGVWVAAPAFGYGAVRIRIPTLAEHRQFYWRSRYRRCVLNGHGSMHQ
jgi:hypothetical protein